MVDAVTAGVAVGGLLLAGTGVAVFRAAAQLFGFVVGAGLTLAAAPDAGPSALLLAPFAGVIGAMFVWQLILFLAWLPGAVGGAILGTMALGVHGGVDAVLSASTPETIGVAVAAFVGGGITVALYLVFVAVGSAALGALLFSVVVTGQFGTFRTATSFEAAVSDVRVLTVWFVLVFVLGLISQTVLALSDA